VDEDAILAAALTRSAPAERQAYLDGACGDDAELRGRVEALLRAREAPDDFLDPRAAGPFVTVPERPVREGPGTVIGPYKLLEQIGEGGFGIVFMAEQTQPLRRKVAVKVLKPGMDTRQVIARFEAERQALALMDHPHIAQVYEGGETASGRPYFVMELVRGIPITEFCDHNNLSVRERLGLMVDVCQAVQHAHQKGVIHRDLKPSNVLVTLHDDKAVAKVIDFGIAKAAGQQLTDKTLFTNFAQMVGTPLYMSPEQAQMSGLDVDTRSDIYSLGVMLYELLTGTTPFDKERLRAAGYDEIRRIIREEEPAKPSTRVSTLGQAASTASARRRSDPKRLSRLFRGELDWIVMKCLEKDRSRRYETANGLARDLQRFLADEPVQACPPSAGYRLRKFARKYRAPLRIAGAFAALLVLAAAVGTWQAVRATLAERQAVAERDRAEASFRMARDAVDRLFTQVSQSPKLKAQGMERFRKDLLLDARGFYERFVREQFDAPGVRHDLALAHHRLAEIDRELGDYAAAEEAATKAAALLRELVLAQPEAAEYRRDLAASCAALGHVYFDTASWDKADAAYREALAIQEEQAGAHPETAEYRCALARTCGGAALANVRADRPDRGGKLYRQALDILADLVRNDPGVPEYQALTAETQLNAGQLWLIQGHPAEAETALKEARRIYEGLVRGRSDVPPEHQEALAKSHAVLGYVYQRRAEYDKAEAAQQEALTRFEKLAEEHRDVQAYAYDVGRCYFELALTAEKMGRTDAALARYDRAIAIMEGALGKGYLAAQSAVQGARINRAIGRARRGDHARAADEAEVVTRHGDLSGANLYDLACLFGRCCGAADRDTRLVPAERSRLKAHYADRAMDFLHQAVARGWRHAPVLKNDADLDPLRAREDFQKLRAELEGNSNE
jgi:serine/threonine protein kinase/tetratricopeptide (TPR) repeat protein